MTPVTQLACFFGRVHAPIARTSIVEGQSVLELDTVETHQSHNFQLDRALSAFVTSIASCIRWTRSMRDGSCHVLGTIAKEQFFIRGFLRFFYFVVCCKSSFCSELNV